MFCEEPIQKVYIGVVENDDLHNHDAFLDCYHDIAYHCTEGYRLVLVTENYAISLCTKGVMKESKETLFEYPKEWLQNGTELLEGDEHPWILFETTLFVGERLVSVSQENHIFLLQFEDFILKLIPHTDDNFIEGVRNRIHGAYNYVFGCDRHLKSKCSNCGGDGEILLDFVNDYIVRCKECKHSTWAGINIIDAIDDWNAGELNCVVDNITIDYSPSPSTINSHHYQK